MLKEEQFYHTVVLLEIKEEKVYLYDPWNGKLIGESAEKVFEEGFQMELGKGIIKWIQLLKE